MLHMFRSGKPQLCTTFSACLGVETHTSPKHLLKMQTFFAKILSPKHFWKCPKLERRDSGPASCLRGPGPSLSVASIAAPLESRNSAALTWPFNAAWCSGVEPQALSLGSRRPPWLRGVGEEADFAETTKVVGSCVPPVQPTVSDSTSSKLFKAKYIHKRNAQGSIHLSCK